MRFRSRRVVATAVAALAMARATPSLAQDRRDGPSIVIDAGATGPRVVSWFGAVTLGTPRVALGRQWTFSTDTTLAREPSPAMVRSVDGVRAAWLDGWRGAWSMSFAHLSGRSEVAVTGRGALTRLDAGQRDTPASNDNGSWTWLVDAMVDVRWYGARCGCEAGVRDRLMPAIDAWIGIKHDRRFHRAGDLDPFDDPTGRVEGGVRLAPWTWPSPAAGRAAVALGAAVEFETALRTGVRLPGMMRGRVSASVDLGRALEMTR